MVIGRPIGASSARPARFALVLGVVATLLAGTVCVVMIFLGLQAVGDRGAPLFFDWRSYADATQRLFDGRSLYSAAQLSGPYHLNDTIFQGYSYPPVAAILMAPFTLGTPGLVTFLAVSVGLFLGGIAAILRRELGELALGAFAIVVLSLAFFVPFLSGVVTGNVSMAIAGLYAWSWLARGDRRWVAVGGTIGAAVKLIPGALVVWAARRGIRRAALISLVCGGLLIVGTLPFVGLSAWHDYVIAMANNVPICGGLPSVPCFLDPLVGAQEAEALALLLTGALLLAALILPWDSVAFLLIGLAMLTPVGDIWDHYLLIPYVSVVALAARGLALLRARAGQTPSDNSLARSATTAAPSS